MVFLRVLKLQQTFFRTFVATHRRFKMVQAPCVKFHDGHKVPVFGLGTWNSEPKKVTEAVKCAIALGYRHIDCAYIYGNEKEVGAALSATFKEGIIKREDIFVTSKLWNTFHRPDLVEPMCCKTLDNLCLDYLNLYLMHWPTGLKEGKELQPQDEKGKFCFSDVDYLDTWKAMEKLVPKCLTKSIGVSNFNIEQMKRIIECGKMKPVTNQVECHPYLNQKKLAKYLDSQCIILTAYSPLGSPGRLYAKPTEPILLEDKDIKDLARRYSKTPAQILLRYQFQRGNITIPKSVTNWRIRENFDIFTFQLCPGDMYNLDSLDRNERYCPFTEVEEHKYYPF